jgi:hypothetical protein
MTMAAGAQAQADALRSSRGASPARSLSTRRQTRSIRSSVATSRSASTGTSGSLGGVLMPAPPQMG